MISPLKLTPPSPAPKPLGPEKEPHPLWATSGVREKPAPCKRCPFRTSGSGFVPAWFPDSVHIPKLALLLDFPSSDDVLDQRPWAGRAGYAWEEKYLRPLGLTRNEVLIDHVLRCQPKERRFGKPVYPTAGLKRSAELVCRGHDGSCWGGNTLRVGGILGFDPNVFVTTFSPLDALAVPAIGRLIGKDLEKALNFYKKGYRPMVLMGDAPRDLVQPWTMGKGGSKTWRGNWIMGEWPFKENSSLVEPGVGFLEA